MKKQWTEFSQAVWQTCLLSVQKLFGFSPVLHLRTCWWNVTPLWNGCIQKSKNIVEKNMDWNFRYRTSAIISCVYFFISCLFTFLSAVCLLFHQLLVYFFISCLFTFSIKGSGHEMGCLWWNDQQTHDHLFVYFTSAVCLLFYQLFVYLLHQLFVYF